MMPMSLAVGSVTNALPCSRGGNASLTMKACPAAAV
jgi:hypothetical protein